MPIRKYRMFSSVGALARIQLLLMHERDASIAARRAGRPI
jgi:hypothetical protein